MAPVLAAISGSRRTTFRRVLADSPGDPVSPDMKRSSQDAAGDGHRRDGRGRGPIPSGPRGVGYRRGSRTPCPPSVMTTRGPPLSPREGWGYDLTIENC